MVHNDIIKKQCHKCGCNKFFSRQNGMRCSKCKSKPTVLKSYKNKHGKERTKIVEK